MTDFQIDTLLADVSQRCEEIEKARRLPNDIAQAMAAAGLFRMTIPKALGGLEMPLADSLDVLQRVAASDASAGWCLMIAITSAYKSGFVDVDTGQELYGDPLGIYGGVFAPMGMAGNQRGQKINGVRRI